MTVWWRHEQKKPKREKTATSNGKNRREGERRMTLIDEKKAATEKETGKRKRVRGIPKTKKSVCKINGEEHKPFENRILLSGTEAGRLGLFFITLSSKIASPSPTKRTASR